MIWSNLIQFDPIQFDPIQFDPIQFDLIQFDPIQFDLIWPNLTELIFGSLKADRIVQWGACRLPNVY